MKNALILGRSNGAGLDRDAAVVGAVLADCGFAVICPPWKSPWAALAGGPVADIAVHLERVAPWWWRHKATTHLLIPNQERFPHRLLGKLRRIDQVLCKSQHAAEIFRPLHPKVEFMGFSSPDGLLADAVPDYHRFFHLAGRSTLKNTGLLVELWQRHPEWPSLTLVQHRDNAPRDVPPNIDLVTRHLSDPELRQLQNHHGIHLCPSLSEGWGHYIVEAMSCRAVVVTTDAPPMNELVTNDHGRTVPVVHSEPRHLGRNYFVDPAALEATIAQLIIQPAAEKQALGAAARQWFEDNERDFHARLATLLGC